MAIFGGWRLTRAGVLFIIGIIVLAGAVFGGVWLVRERGEQARRGAAIEIAQQNLEEQSQQPVTTPVDEADSSDTNTKTPTQPTTPSTTQSTEALPATGPELFLPILAVAALALAGSYYVASRRAMADL